MDKHTLLEIGDAFVRKALAHKLPLLYPELTTDEQAELVKVLYSEMCVGKGPGYGGFTGIADRFGLPRSSDPHRLYRVTADILATMHTYGPEVAQEESLNWIEWSY